MKLPFFVTKKMIEHQQLHVFNLIYKFSSIKFHRAPTT